MTDESTHRTRHATRLFWVVLCAFTAMYAFAVVRTAWVTDDAYITFRTIDNFLNGFGLRWNTAERVQTYTHPLWLLLLSGVMFFTREMFLTAIVVSAVTSVAAFVVIVGRLSRSVAGALCGALLLFLSHSYISFSTSGLENSLSHLIAALFLFVLFRHPPGSRRSFLVALLAGLGAVNRLDLFLLFAPAVAFEIWESRKPRATAAGFVPLVLWLVFSFFYYGFLLPNSAYAKLSTGLGRVEYLRQGFYYFSDSFYRDTLTLVSTVVVAAAGVVARSGRRRAVGVGILLYVLYVAWVGGDFMRGRFFTVPLAAASGLLVDADLFTKRRIRYAVPVAIAALGLLNPVPNVLAGKKQYRRRVQTMYHGITDERLYYLDNVSLFFGKPLSDQPGHDMAALRRRQAIEITRVKLALSAGIAGLNAGPRTYVVDEWALGDALRARLPMVTDRWRIGHFPRAIPAGYLVSLVTGENRIHDEKIHAYYEHLRRITRDPLFDATRLRSVVAMNIGRYSGLLEGNTGFLQNGPEDFAEAVEADIDAPGPRILWGAARHYLFERDFERAERALRRLSSLEIAGSDDYIKGAVQIGTMFAGAAPEFAERLLRLMRELEPESPYPAYGLGRFLCETGRGEEGRPLVEAAAPGLPAARRWLETH